MKNLEYKNHHTSEFLVYYARTFSILIIDQFSSNTYVPFETIAFFLRLISSPQVGTMQPSAVQGIHLLSLLLSSTKQSASVSRKWSQEIWAKCPSHFILLKRAFVLFQEKTWILLLLPVSIWIDKACLLIQKRSGIWIIVGTRNVSALSSHHNASSASNRNIIIFLYHLLAREVSWLSRPASDVELNECDVSTMRDRQRHLDMIGSGTFLLLEADSC